MSAFTKGGTIYPFRAADTDAWTWALGEPLVWEVRGAGRGFDLTVPQGFVSDLGSIPWWCRWAVNPADPQLAKAFILHDWILAEFGPACQPFAASQLYEAMRALGAPQGKRKLIAVAVVAAIDDW
jgi:hypothetical protein